MPSAGSTGRRSLPGGMSAKPLATPGLATSPSLTRADNTGHTSPTKPSRVAAPGMPTPPPPNHPPIHTHTHARTHCLLTKGVEVQAGRQHLRNLGRSHHGRQGQPVADALGHGDNVGEDALRGSTTRGGLWHRAGASKQGRGCACHAAHGATYSLETGASGEATVKGCAWCRVSHSLDRRTNVRPLLPARLLKQQPAALQSQHPGSAT